MSSENDRFINKNSNKWMHVPIPFMDKILQRLIGQMTGVFSKSEVFSTKMTSKLSNVNLQT